MQHLVLAFITMGVIWTAWRNFKQLGMLKLADATISVELRQRQQMRYVMRIVLCFLALAVMPFLFTVITK